MSPTAPDGKVCRDCKWCDGSNCHRYPPQMVPWPDDNQHPITYNPMATFPFVGPNDWCGEWSKSE
jgi:hypothetical protein